MPGIAVLGCGLPSVPRFQTAALVFIDVPPGKETLAAPHQVGASYSELMPTEGLSDISRAQRYVCRSASPCVLLSRSGPFRRLVNAVLPTVFSPQHHKACTYSSACTGGDTMLSSACTGADTMLVLQTPAWELVVRGFVMYLIFIILLRLFGKRQLGQLTIFDLVLILLGANAVQPAMTGVDTSLTGGLLLATTFFVADRSVSWLALRVPAMQRLLESPPTVLARDGRWDRRALRREMISLEEAQAALRRAGLQEVQEARLVVLESDGTISVVPKR